MSKRRELAGRLIKYGEKSSQVAFETGIFNRQVIFLGGLEDGLLATRYIEPLAQALCAIGWSLVQPLLSSSHSGYGMATLDQDAAEIEQLIRYLIDEEGSEGVFLIGHSTGCQDIVHYLRKGTNYTRAVRGAILQAPVSDREYLATLPDTQKFLQIAEKMIADGRKLDLMPLEANHNTPITAFRYHSLAGMGGQDDMFSSDLSREDLVDKLGHMGRIQTQVIFSMADEYIPENVDKRGLLNRLCQAMGGAEKVAIEGGTHDLSNRITEAVRAMVDFIKMEGPKGWDDPWN